MLNTSVVTAVRRRTLVAAVTALALCGGYAVMSAQPAAANPIAAQSFNTPGSYTIAVPERAVAVTLVGVGRGRLCGRLFVDRPVDRRRRRFGYAGR
jgi:hypothetical protein